jgi:tetratricopeptide (TPR) repeat protein
MLKRKSSGRTASFLLLFGLLQLAPCVVAAPAPSTSTAGASDSTPAPGGNLSLEIAPNAVIPLSSASSVVALGGGLSLGAAFSPWSFPLSFRGGLQYGFGATKSTPTLSLLSATLGVGYELPLASFLAVGVSADGGISYCFFNPPLPFEGYLNPYLRAGLGLKFRFSPGFSVDAGGSFQYQAGLFSGMGLSLGTTISPGQLGPVVQPPSGRLPPQPLESGPGVEIRGIELSPVFPVFYKHYDSHKVGTVKLTNAGSDAVGDVRVRLFVRDFMNAAQEMVPVGNLAGGQSAEVDLFALFSDRILTVTERTKVQAELTVSWQAGGVKREASSTGSLPVLDRNGMSWDDDRKAAAFVTAKDTPVIAFAKTVAGAIKEKGSAAVNKNLLAAMAMHEALSQYGLSYVVDPKSSYAAFSAQEAAVDYLQFPRQTLSFKAGDCDDLSILNCALLESIGIETAFVTVPGHIYMAFSLGMEPEEARKSFSRVDTLILREGKSWVPVEITSIKEGFLQAWDEGAKGWRENAGKNQAQLWPLAEAWKIYEPVYFRGEDVQVTALTGDQYVGAFLKEQTRYIEGEIAGQVARLTADIQKAQGDAKPVNKLGILYAKWGLGDRAREQFQRILKSAEYYPALVNLGNLALMEKKYPEAVGYFERGLKANERGAEALLGLARVNHEQENYGTVRGYYERLTQIDRALADRYSYLALRGEESTRAAERGS